MSNVITCLKEPETGDFRNWHTEPEIALIYSK